MKQQLYILTVFCLSLFLCQAQNKISYKYVDQAKQEKSTNNLSLVDTATGIKYSLDSARVYITATGTDGKQLWHIDPWKDSKHKSNKEAHPQIIIFDFASNKSTYDIEVIWIIYSNAQFGFVEKQTGKVTLLNQY